MDGILRVHSSDLHQHIVEQIAECFESGLYTDLVVKCKDGQMLHAHKLVLSAVSPFLKMLLEPDETVSSNDIQTIELAEVEFNDAQLLIDVIYNGLVEATMDELRSLIQLARYLYINIPISKEMCSSLNLDLPPMPTLMPTLKRKGLPSPNHTSPVSANVVPGGLVLPKIPSLLSPPPLKRFKEDLTLLPPMSLMPPINLNNLPLPPSLMPTSPLPNISPITGANPKEYRCPICNSIYGNMGNFKQHMKFHQNESMKEERAALLNSMVSACYDPDSQRYNCEICNSFYTHPGNFKQHLGKHERECGAVTALFNQKNGIPSPEITNSLNGNNGHLSNVLQNAIADKMDEGEKQKYQYHCDICGRSFKHPGNFKQHMASHMRAVTYSKSVTVNGVVAANEESQRAQDILQSQLQGGPSLVATPALAEPLPSVIKCDICDDIFETKALLLNHKENFHSPNGLSSDIINLYQCDEPGCLQSFSKEGWLQRHMKKDHPPQISVYDNVDGTSKIYACRTCGKEFKNSSKLSAHMKVHRPEEDHYKYPCEICGKKFTRPQHVTRHKLLHTGEKPFLCFKCNKTFNREDKLKEHQKAGCDVSAGHPEDLNDDDFFDEDEHESLVQVELTNEDEDSLGTEDGNGDSLQGSSTGSPYVGHFNASHDIEDTTLDHIKSEIEDDDE